MPPDPDEGARAQERASPAHHLSRQLFLATTRGVRNSLLATFVNMISFVPEHDKYTFSAAACTLAGSGPDGWDRQGSSNRMLGPPRAPPTGLR